jgi:hypothetical protein
MSGGVWHHPLVEKRRLVMRAATMALAFLLTGFAGFGAAPALNAQGGAAWKTIFDGKSLAGWTPVGNANWKLAEGAVEANMGTGFLVSKDSYGDFELRAEVWASDDANSGIFIRCSNPKEITAMNAYEVNIFDKRPDPAYRTGAIVDVAKPSAMVNAGGKWNTLVITAKGPRMTVTLNGTQTVDVQHSAHTSGPVALQYGAGVVKFRKVEIR